MSNNQNKTESLLAKDVFVISQGQASEGIYISWNIKDGYYMYLDSIKLKDINNNIPFEIVESHQSLFEDGYRFKIIKMDFTRTAKSTLEYCRYRMSYQLQKSSKYIRTWIILLLEQFLFL